jgi:DNA-binding GntR family transcriptional regulator
MSLKEKYKTKSGFVYELLRDRIVSGEWPQGTGIVVATVARELGVSAIPVREAMKQLQAEGLVVLEPHRGARVTVFDPKKIVEVMSIRGALEGYAARIALPFIDETLLSELRRKVEEMGKLAEEMDDERLIAANKEFHRRIYCMGPFPLLNDMIFKLWDGGAYSHVVFAFRPERIRTVHEDHIAILDAIERRDGDEVERLIRAHKMSLAEVLCEITAKSRPAP